MVRHRQTNRQRHTHKIRPEPISVHRTGFRPAIRTSDKREDRWKTLRHTRSARTGGASSGINEMQLYTQKMDEFWRVIINSGTPIATYIPDTEFYATTAFKKTISTATELTASTTPG